MADKTSGTRDWELSTMPDFRGRKAFVLPGAFAGAIRVLMLEAGFAPAESIIDADVVVFSGGEDINPALYGEKPTPMVRFWSDSRDNFEKKTYYRCLRDKKFMFGICRGAQFLAAMNGAKLWQHVDGHAGRDHYIVDLEEDVRVKATSIHHQMVREHPELTVVAVAEDQVSDRFHCEQYIRHATKDLPVMEVEAGYYSKTGCFIVQGHPEVGSPQYRSWTMTKLHDFVTEYEIKTGKIHVPIKQENT